jgi:hypothetical protein
MFSPLQQRIREVLVRLDPLGFHTVDTVIACLVEESPQLANVAGVLICVVAGKFPVTDDSNPLWILE